MLRVKQLIYGSLNGMRIKQSLPQLYIPQKGTRVPWKVQRLVVWSDLRVRDAVDFRETDGGEVREEIVVQNASGGKPGSHGSKVILLSHT